MKTYACPTKLSIFQVHGSYAEFLVAAHAWYVVKIPDRALAITWTAAPLILRLGVTTYIEPL